MKPPGMTAYGMSLMTGTQGFTPYGVEQLHGIPQTNPLEQQHTLFDRIQKENKTRNENLLEMSKRNSYVPDPDPIPDYSCKSLLPDPEPIKPLINFDPDPIPDYSYKSLLPDPEPIKPLINFDPIPEPDYSYKSLLPEPEPIKPLINFDSDPVPDYSYKSILPEPEPFPKYENNLLLTSQPIDPFLFKK